jgi:N utilization substance protein A
VTNCRRSISAARRPDGEAGDRAEGPRIERKRQFEEFKDRKNEIINGLVKRVEFGNVTVDLGRGESLLRRDELLPRETFRNGDRVRALIMDVREEPRGPQIFLSRTHPQFMAKLFAQEVPEIYDGIIEIKSVARDRSRAKIGVVSRDSGIDPVKLRRHAGSRVQAVVQELQGEKIDIILVAGSATYRHRAGAGGSLQVADEDPAVLKSWCRMTNCRWRSPPRPECALASQLTGFEIDIPTEAQELASAGRVQVPLQMFMDALDVDDVTAHLFTTEGFTSVEEWRWFHRELTSIAVDYDVASELKARARLA